MKILESVSSAKMKFSKPGAHYPGTTMRELTIQAGSVEAMVGAMVLALSQVAAEETSTAPGSEAGDVHVKVVLPVEAAQALEDGGLKSVELAACVRGRVIPQVLPPGPRTVSSEQ
ncbi:unnamed protein product, partial [Polarella glacialis]